MDPNLSLSFDGYCLLLAQVLTDSAQGTGIQINYHWLAVLEAEDRHGAAVNASV